MQLQVYNQILPIYYLKETYNLWLTYSGYGDLLKDFTNIDENMTKNQYTTFKYAFIINEDTVLQSTKKQELEERWYSRRALC